MEKEKPLSDDDRIYNWEKNSIFPLIKITAPWALHKLTEDQAMAFLVKIFGEKSTDRPKLLINFGKTKIPVIQEGRVRPKLIMPEDYLRPIMLLHQAALIKSGSDTIDTKFINEYIELLDKYVGIKPLAARLTLKENGIENEQPL